MGRPEKNYSAQIKERARELRRQGWSYGEIKAEMGIPKNTIQGWVKNTSLSAEQKEHLAKRTREKILASGAIGRPIAVRLMKGKIEKWKAGIVESVKHFGDIPLTNTNIGKLVCGLLYICEGGKYPSTRSVQFGNSDPGIVRCFLNLLRKCFEIDENKLRCRITPRCDQNIQALNSYWSHVTKIPLQRFYKTKPDERTRGQSTRKEDYMGICVVYYCDTSLQFRLMAIGERIIESGAGGIRTLDPNTASVVRSQLRYGPIL
jgi:hypothetical protein